MRSTALARLVAGLLATAVTLLGPLAAAPAHADGEGGGGDAFRYWAYFHVEDDEYVAAQGGLADFTPDDGSVEALRYAAPADFEDPNLPRADLGEVDFEAVCATTEAGSGEKRIAVILDFGVEADAPSGAETAEPTAACASVPQEANSLQALQDVAEPRTKSTSFGPQLCGIDGYPATGCSEPAQSATPPDDGTVEFAIAGRDTGEEEPGEATSAETADAEDDGSSVALYVALGVVALALLVGGFVLARRRA